MCIGIGPMGSRGFTKRQFERWEWRNFVGCGKVAAYDWSTNARHQVDNWERIGEQLTCHSIIPAKIHWKGNGTPIVWSLMKIHILQNLVKCFHFTGIFPQWYMPSHITCSAKVTNIPKKFIVGGLICICLQNRWYNAFKRDFRYWSRICLRTSMLWWILFWANKLLSVAAILS